MNFSGLIFAFYIVIFIAVVLFMILLSWVLIELLIYLMRKNRRLKAKEKKSLKTKKNS